MKQITGMYLMLVAVSVGVHAVVEPLYHVSSAAQPYSAAWNILNPMMVLAIVLGLIFGYIRKSGVDGDGGALSREYFVANTLFYGFLFVGILFFWNWFNLHSPAFTAVGDETVSLVWILIDAILPLVTGAMGMHLVRGSRGGG